MTKRDSAPQYRRLLNSFSTLAAHHGPGLMLAGSIIALLAWAWVRAGRLPHRNGFQLGAPRDAVKMDVLGTNRADAVQTPANRSTVQESSPDRGAIFYVARGGGFDHLYARFPFGSFAYSISAGDWNDRDPAISPDGRKMAFASHREGNWDLYLLDFETFQIRRLTQTKGFEGNPAWSPDGKWIAFEADYDGDLDIWIIPLEAGAGPIQLTDHPGADMEPSWHPEGRLIAFVSDREGEADIFLADLDGAEDRFRNLTGTPTRVEKDPAFSPDGRFIAYTSMTEGVAQIVQRAAEDGWGDMHYVGQGRKPAWSQDGEAIAALYGGPQYSYISAYAVDPSDFQPLGGFGPAQYQDVAWGDIDLAALAEESRGGIGFMKAVEPPGPVGWNSLSGRLNLAPLEGVEAPNPSLLEGVDHFFELLRERTAQEAGWDFLASLQNAFVGLNEPLPPGSSYEDWLYTGRAFAFDLASVRARWTEVVREEYGGQTFWRIFLRTSAQDGSLGEPLRSRPWDFEARYGVDPTAYDRGGALREEIPSGYYVDFTQLALDYGFERLPAMANWRNFYYGARFNQFVLTSGLTWEQAMLQLYPVEAIATPTAFKTPTPTATPTHTPTPTLTPTMTPWAWEAGGEAEIASQTPSLLIVP